MTGRVIVAGRSSDPTSDAVRDEVWRELADRRRAIASPGSHWTGAQRAAIAAEIARARRCVLCAERRAALSPAAVEGRHEAVVHLVRGEVVDAVHRIVTDPSRLTARWYAELVPRLLTASAYVELVGVVASAVVADTLARALGRALSDLPEPRPGRPDGRSASGATRNSAWVPTVEPSAAAGDLAACYERSAALGFVANITRALSLVPAEQIGFSSLMDVMYLSSEHQRTQWNGDGPVAGRALSRPQIELLAATTSRLNECFY